MKYILFAIAFVFIAFGALTLIGVTSMGMGAAVEMASLGVIGCGVIMAGVGAVLHELTKDNK